jgi:chromosome partitioning protein
VISRFLDDIQEEMDYDFILIDCPPTSNLIIQSVFLACDYYLIPTVGDEISTDGVADYITEIESAYLKYAYDDKIGGAILKYYFGKRPESIGVLETMYKGRSGNRNMSILKALDGAISAVKPESMITETEYTYPGYRHIFNTNKIKYLPHPEQVPNKGRQNHRGR